MNQRSRSNVVTLPRWLGGAALKPKKKRVYVTQTQGTQWHPGAVAVALAFCLRMHDSADALRGLARRLADVALPEHRPSLMALWRAKDDGAVFRAALRIIDEVCRRWEIDPENPFQRNAAPPQPPRCHMKPMKLAGYHQHRHWKCQHCSHTKPLDLDKPQEAIAC